MEIYSLCWPVHTVYLYEDERKKGKSEAAIIFSFIFFFIPPLALLHWISFQSVDSSRVGGGSVSLSQLNRILCQRVCCHVASKKCAAFSKEQQQPSVHYKQKAKYT